MSLWGIANLLSSASKQVCLSVNIQFACHTQLQVRSNDCQQTQLYFKAEGMDTGIELLKDQQARPK